MNYYATIPAPASLRELADTLADSMRSRAPAESISSTGASARASTTSGVPATSGRPRSTASPASTMRSGRRGRRLAGLDSTGRLSAASQAGHQDHDRPRRGRNARPRWRGTSAPSMHDTAFTFVPPKDAKRITLVEARASAVDALGGMNHVEGEASSWPASRCLPCCRSRSRCGPSADRVERRGPASADRHRRV